MMSVAEILADPVRRSAVRAVWVGDDLAGLVDAGAVNAARIGEDIVPHERGYVVDELGLTATWEITVPYPDSASVRGLALVLADELLAAGGGDEDWSTSAFGGWATVTLTVQRGDVWQD